MPADIAVVMPLHNHARYVAAALESVRSQQPQPAELVVIDDGSADDGGRIAEAVLRGVAGARVLHQPNSGTAATLNRAVALTQSPWIAVLNSDDVFAAGKLARCQALIASDPVTALIAGGIGLIDADGRRLRTGVAADWLRRAADFAVRAAHPPLALLNENFVATTSNMVFARGLWQRLDGFAPLRYCHDLDFLVRAFSAGHVVIDAAQEHVFYRVHDGNTIMEDVRAVRVELAAVIAVAIDVSGSGLLPADDAHGFAVFHEFLRNKGMSDLVLYFVALRRRFADLTAFYRYVAAEPQRARFAAHLGAPC